MDAAETRAGAEAGAEAEASAMLLLVGTAGGPDNTVAVTLAALWAADPSVLAAAASAAASWAAANAVSGVQASPNSTPSACAVDASGISNGMSWHTKATVTRISCNVGKLQNHTVRTMKRLRQKV